MREGMRGRVVKDNNMGWRWNWLREVLVGLNLDVDI